MVGIYPLAQCFRAAAIRVADERDQLIAIHASGADVYLDELRRIAQERVGRAIGVEWDCTGRNHARFEVGSDTIILPPVKEPSRVLDCRASFEHELCHARYTRERVDETWWDRLCDELDRRGVDLPQADFLDCFQLSEDLRIERLACESADEHTRDWLLLNLLSSIRTPEHVSNLARRRGWVRTATIVAGRHAAGVAPAEVRDAFVALGESATRATHDAEQSWAEHCAIDVIEAGSQIEPVVTVVRLVAEELSRSSVAP